MVKMSFQHCKIIGAAVDSTAYHAAQTAPRGSKEFVMSSSGLRKFAHCPQKWLRGHEQAGTASTLYGNLFDTLALLPVCLDRKYTVRPATYEKKVLRCPQCGSVTESKECRKCKVNRVEAVVTQEWSRLSETCQLWEAEQEKNGKTVVEQDGSDKYPGLNQARAAVERLRHDEILRSFLDDSEKQVHVAGQWADERTGVVVPCQCLIDLVPEAGTRWRRCLGDLKTARSAYPPFWRAQSRDMGYNVQAAWNLGMYNAATGEGRETFCFLISENSHPWEIGREMMTFGQEGDQRNSKLDLGRIMYESWMDWYCGCLAENRWPGYDDTPESVDGWSLDFADARDEAAAMRAMELKPALAADLEVDVPDNNYLIP